MYWQYRTILFEFHKDGLLGDKYVDDEEVEKILNEQGEQGWELVSVTAVQEGLLTFFKKIRQQATVQQAARSGHPGEARSEVLPGKPATVPPLQPGAAQQAGRKPQPGEQPLAGPKKKGNMVGEIKIS